MEKEKFKKIIEYNKENKIKIKTEAYTFYQELGRDNPTVIADIEGMANLLLETKGYKVVHIPINSNEIGALKLTLNQSNFIIINTARSVANNNFSIAHELYHVLIQKEKTNAEIYSNEHYEEDVNERMANAFAGNILMPEDDFISTFDSLNKMVKKENLLSKDNYGKEILIILTLMNMYKTTYMSVVIRCYECDKLDIEDNEMLEVILEQNNEDALTSLCAAYSAKAGKESIMRKTRIDDFSNLLEEIESKKSIVSEDYNFDEEDFNYKQLRFKEAYEAIREKN